LHTAPFQVYNAAAGSGKTFTLVKEYLKILLNSPHPYKFQEILAVTFTNKAAGEMKARVLAHLQAFSKQEPGLMSTLICEETGLQAPVIFKRSEAILRAILRRYAAFNITTIDSFTYRLVSTFARDLKLPMNAEVELDKRGLLDEAVDLVISSIGVDASLTKSLIDYAGEKLYEDKSWDISKDLKSFAEILLNEDDIPYLKPLGELNIQAVDALKKTLRSKNALIAKAFKEIGETALKMLKDQGLEMGDFAYGGELPRHFVKLTDLQKLTPENLKFDGRLNKTILAEKPLFSKKCDLKHQEVIQAISADLRALYERSRDLYNQQYSDYLRNGLFLESLVPLAVLGHISHALEELKKRNHILLNAEFNTLISNTIKDQPAPFIYERLGEKFRYYFIDEMQDTSVLQWTNLIPLISEALSSENEQGEVGKLVLVGDAKQSIYRWRGGKAAQFMNLSSTGKGKENNPFFVQKDIQDLAVNYRSFGEIIQFNNAFFTHLSRFFGREDYRNLYALGNRQEAHKKGGGYVQVSFVEKRGQTEEKNQVYPKKVLSVIHGLPPGFLKKDVCVLVRTRKQGEEVANYLSDNGVEIISSETLLLKNNPKVTVAIDLMYMIQEPDNQTHKINVSYFLQAFLQVGEPKHAFFDKMVGLSNSEFLEALEDMGIFFDEQHFVQQPLYTAVAYLINRFGLANSPDAYLSFFLDTVFEFAQQKQGLISHFLAHWELKKDRLSLVAPEVESAVRIMTIHKAKGLEFPIVIFPYDLAIYQQINPKVWYPYALTPSIKAVLVSYSKKLLYLGAEGEALYKQRREALELDTINLLYVALTRAVQQLYVITEKPSGKRPDNTYTQTSDFFADYLREKGLWQETQNDYGFGDPQQVEKTTETAPIRTISPQAYTRCAWDRLGISVSAHSSLLWETEKGTAIAYGNLLHDLLSSIKTADFIEEVLERYLFRGVISADDIQPLKTKLLQVVQHPALCRYFDQNKTVYSERPIYTGNNTLVIPDRLVLQGDRVTIIDYKTGKASATHQQQLNHYATVLTDMGYSVESKILVYIDQEVTVQQV